jgi:transmembrane sensor
MTAPEQSEGEPSGLNDEVAATFVASRYGKLDAEARLLLERHLQNDSAFAARYAQAGQCWNAVGRHAGTPEMVVLREQALASARQAAAHRWHRSPGVRRRWLAVCASLIAIAATGAISWQLSPYGYRPGAYVTDIGEQKSIELSDHSRVALDAQTRIRVRYSGETRLIEIFGGQAQFTVAQDPIRPFKVIAGTETIVALGTRFNVEYIDREVRIAMLEGKVAVVRADSSRDIAAGRVESQPIALAAGEGLRVSGSGKATFTPAIDLQVVNAWRQNEVVFRAEPLREAVRRMNRYSHLQLAVESAELAQLRVTGMFDAGDARAFADAVESSLPLVADYSDPNLIRLRAR